MIKYDYSLPYEDRCKVVEEAIERYYQQNYRVPPPLLLEELSDYLLSDILKDKNTAKHYRQEYPILSRQQLKRRSKKESIMDEEQLSYFNLSKKYQKKASKPYET